MVAICLFDRMVEVSGIFVLVRLHSPADFGLVVIAMSMVALHKFIGEFRLDAAHLQR